MIDRNEVLLVVVAVFMLTNVPVFADDLMGSMDTTGRMPLLVDSPWENPLADGAQDNDGSAAAEDGSTNSILAQPAKNTIQPGPSTVNPNQLTQEEINAINNRLDEIEDELADLDADIKDAARAVVHKENQVLKAKAEWMLLKTEFTKKETEMAELDSRLQDVNDRINNGPPYLKSTGLETTLNDLVTSKQLILGMQASLLIEMASLTNAGNAKKAEAIALNDELVTLLNELIDLVEIRMLLMAEGNRLLKRLLDAGLIV